MLKRVKLLVLEVNTLISQIMLGLIYPIVFFFPDFTGISIVADKLQSFFLFLSLFYFSLNYY